MNTKKKLFFIIGIITALLLSVVVLLTVLRVGQEKPVAPTVPEAEPEAAEITLVVPDDYNSCSTTAFSDTIRTTNVGSRRLEGYVEVQFVLGNAPRQVYRRYDINQTGDLNLEVSYPPVYEWPTHATGIKEVHVDISIGVYDGNVKILTLGPGQDWDVYCTANIPSAPPGASPRPSPSASLAPTPRPTPRVSPSATPRPSPTATPRPTPTATPLPTATPGTGGPNPSPSPSPSPTATPRPSPTATPDTTATPAPTATPGTGGPNPSPSPSPTDTAIAQVYPSPTSSVAPPVPVSGTSLPTMLLMAGAVLFIAVALLAL